MWYNQCGITVWYNQCGITSDTPDSYHRQLRHFAITNEFVEDLIEDDRTDDINGFNIGYTSDEATDVEMSDEESEEEDSSQE